MPNKEKLDYKKLLDDALSLIGRDKSITNMPRIAKLLGVSYTTLVSGFTRNFDIANFSDLAARLDVTEYKIDGEEGEKIEVEFDGNFGNVRAVDVRGQIKTIDQLLKMAKIDLTVWEVYDPEVRKWDVVLKLKDGERDIIEVVPSVYLSARVRRINPVAFEPVVQPVVLPQLPARPLKGRGGGKSKTTVRRALIVNDPQVGFRRRLHTNDLTPFHDRRVLDLALQIAEVEQIDHVSFGGDCLDLSEWSEKFKPEPEFFWTTQPALIEWAWWLYQFRLAKPKAEIKALEGNHDERMPRLIVSGMRQAYRLKPVDELTLPPSLSVPRLLALHELGVDYVDGYPDNGYWLNRNVFISHGDIVRSAPGGTANAITQRQAFTTIFGHIHRREQVARRMKSSDGDLIYSAFCPGCVCHIDGRVPGSTSQSQWQQGIAVVEYTDDAENIIPIAVHDGRMMYNGRLWSARDRDGEIHAMLMEKLEQVTA